MKQLIIFVLKGDLAPYGHFIGISLPPLKLILMTNDPTNKHIPIFHRTCSCDINVTAFVIPTQLLR